MDRVARPLRVAVKASLKPRHHDGSGSPFLGTSHADRAACSSSLAAGPGPSSIGTSFSSRRLKAELVWRLRASAFARLARATPPDAGIPEAPPEREMIFHAPGAIEILVAVFWQ
jgi:hypothetical protein